MCMARTQICANVKDPISICRKRVVFTAGGMETLKHCTQEGVGGQVDAELASAVLWLLAFPGDEVARSNFPCIALGYETVIFSNLIYDKIGTREQCNIIHNPAG